MKKQLKRFLSRLWKLGRISKDDPLREAALARDYKKKKRRRNSELSESY